MVQRLIKNSTVKVTEALQAALMEYANQRKSAVGPEGILIALIDQHDSIVLKIFNHLDLDAGELRRRIVDHALDAMNSLPEFSPGQMSQIRMTKDVENLFGAADRERRRLGDAFISTGALFLACFDGSVPGNEKILTLVELSYDSCKQALDEIRAGQKVESREEESKQSTLKEYTLDLTALARKDQLDPVIGRDEEINRVIQILSRRKKNNPLLIGEPGVGKTVIAEGLANRIAAADVPEYLGNKRILSLEIASLIAGAKMQGEFEERLKGVVDEIKASDGQYILFIDEIHTVVGAGRSSGGLDASNMLKPALAMGQLQCIGATTNREYKQYIEADKALERRFQIVRVNEPSTETSIQILSGIKEKYEGHHKIKYTDEALVAAVELSDRYLQERSLPDKAIDLLDEAGSQKRLKYLYSPPEIRTIEKERNELLELKSKAFNEQDFEQMSMFQMDLARLEEKLSAMKDEYSKTTDQNDRIVNEENIAALISKQTGVPVNKLVAEEAEKLVNLESYLKKRVIGQNHAVKAVSNAIRRNRSGLKRSSTPIASFLFLGPTGVGKTELAKALASHIMDDESKIIRIDMSEFMERHDVSKLIGSPPGYVGYGEGGQLTEQVRRQPYSVILFDEFEKAHPDVFNLLLQVLDEGWLTDSEGQKVSFTNTIVIGTSNLGSEVMGEKKKPIGIGAQLDPWSKDDEVKEVFQIAKKFLRPEFLNRLDELIVFNHLGPEQLEKIIDIIFDDLANRLSDLNWNLNLDSAVKPFILDEIDTHSYGARPLKRKIQDLVENPIANVLLNPKLVEGRQSVDVKVLDQKISISMS